MKVFGHGDSSFALSIGVLEIGWVIVGSDQPLDDIKLGLFLNMNP